ncbi:MAG: tol-pal system YbgF family protein, partial [Actinomycetota bacterium]
VLVAAFGAYHLLGDRQFNSALAAHRAGRCADAVDGYERVTNTYGYALVGSLDQARRGIAECRLFLKAERLSRSDFAGAARGYRAFLAKYPEGPLTELARERLATAYHGWGTDQIADGDHAGGIAKFATALEEFGGTEGARNAEASVDELLADASAGAGRDASACDAVDVLTALVDNQLRVEGTRKPLPNAYFHCARREYRSHDDALAIDHLTILIKDFPKHSLIPQAKALLVDARVDQISGQNTNRVQSLEALGPSISGRTTLVIQNSSPDRLELLLSGPGSKSVIVKKCGSCREYSTEPAFCPSAGPTVDVVVEPGTYEVVLHDPDDAGTRDSYGKLTFAAGQVYAACYFLVVGG